MKMISKFSALVGLTFASVSFTACQHASNGSQTASARVPNGGYSIKSLCTEVAYHVSDKNVTDDENSELDRLQKKCVADALDAGAHDKASNVAYICTESSARLYNYDVIHGKDGGDAGEVESDCTLFSNGQN